VAKYFLAAYINELTHIPYSDVTPKLTKLPLLLLLFFMFVNLLCYPVQYYKREEILSKNIFENRQVASANKMLRHLTDQFHATPT